MRHKDEIELKMSKCPLDGGTATLFKTTLFIGTLSFRTLNYFLMHFIPIFYYCETIFVNPITHTPLYHTPSIPLCSFMNGMEKVKKQMSCICLLSKFKSFLVFFLIRISQFRQNGNQNSICLPATI